VKEVGNISGGFAVRYFGIVFLYSNRSTGIRTRVY
jgi:hypothetical protein